jgi:tagatose 1,6-diphosphate aldolase
MNTISIGKLRGLRQCAAPNGTFTCLAIDHRQNLRRALNLSDSSAAGDAELTGFKLDITADLADLATAVLLDPEYGAAQAIAAGILPNKTGLVVALESTGYTGDPAARVSQMLPGWSIEKARRMGASMVKLLVYFHPEASTAGETEAFVGQVAEECLRRDIGLMLEPLSYPLQADRKLSGLEKRQVVIETARRLTLPGVDVLKAEFPLDPAAAPDEFEWAKACAEISSASRVPWILLSAAVDYPVYLRQVEIACRAGASGIAVGRAVWQEAVELRGAARADFLKNVARPRMERLATLCADTGKPWTDFYTPPEIHSEWYKTY